MNVFRMDSATDVISDEIDARTACDPRLSCSELERRRSVKLFLISCDNLVASSFGSSGTLARLDTAHRTQETSTH